MKSLAIPAQSLLLGTLLVLSVMPGMARAQGCEPIRFTTPVDLGGAGQAYQRAHGWEFTLAWRRLHSDEWFVGTSQDPALAPGGQAPVFNINTVVADVAYAMTDRFHVRVSVPYSSGTVSRLWGDGAQHEQSASGIGDVSATGELWLRNPKAHENGNIALGLGIKAPTGSHDQPSLFYTATGSVAFPADQTVQPGDGGWGITAQARAFRRVAEGWFVYGFGSYMANPKAESDVTFTPTSPVHWSVPDVYGARVGIAFAALPNQGVTLSLGARMDGIPTRDLFGGGDSTTIKRTSNIIFADPGMSLNRGKSTITLSVPIRLHVNRSKSLFEEGSTGQAAINGGGFAKYLVFVSISYRP